MSLSLPTFAQLLVPSEKGCVSLTGGGGKTTFLGVVGRTMKSLGVPVLLTTTTKVQNPFPVDVDWFVAEADPKVLEHEIMVKLLPGTLGLAVKGPYGPSKWDGLPPHLIDFLFSKIQVGVILNEADGARRLPIKAPADHEPVIPTATTVVIPILGLSALETSLNDQHAFRPDLISQLTGLPLNHPVTEQAMARLITHPRGLAKGTPEGIPITPLLNQADSPERVSAGKRIAAEIFRQSGKIDRVFVGCLKPQPVIEVIERSRGLKTKETEAG